MKSILPIFAMLLSSVHADLVITEVMAKSGHSANTAFDGDWWELTNTGTAEVNLNGYKWDDATPSASIFPNVTIGAGQTIIILDEVITDVSAWKGTWGLNTTVLSGDQFTGAFSNFSANGDEVNLYNPSGTLVAHVEFGTSVAGRSQAFLRDGTAIYELHSNVREHGAGVSTQNAEDVASPGDAKTHFTSAPPIYGMSTYSYSISAYTPGSSAPTISAVSITPTASFLTLTGGAGGVATLSNNRPLTLADAGNYLVRLTATSAASTVQEYMLTILNPSPSVILNEYNAVSSANFLNGGTATTDDDAGALSTDTHFGRVAGNGGPWVEFAVVGTGGAGLVDLRGWKIEIGKNLGAGFVKQNTLVLSNHANLQKIPTGTILTFTANNALQGGRDTGFAIRNRRSTLGDTWTNLWMGDSSFLNYTDSIFNGYTLSGGVVSGIAIDNNGTQFRVIDSGGKIVYGPVGEGVAPLSGTNAKEVFELENHPTPSISPTIASAPPSTQGYGDGASGSTFGSPNQWLSGVTTIAQSFLPYVPDGFQLWTEGQNLAGADSQRSADPDSDGRNNHHEYAFGGNPTVKDGPYPAGAVTVGAQVGWTYVRRSNDPALAFRHQSSENLRNWNEVSPTSPPGIAPFPGNSEFSSVTVSFTRPASPKWFLRAVAE